MTWIITLLSRLLRLVGYRPTEPTPLPNRQQEATVPELQEPKNFDVSKDITYCHPYLKERWPQVLARFREDTGNDLVITCTWRSVKEQQRLYSLGRTVMGQIVTNCDGVEKKSNHNYFPARAVDVAVNIAQDAVKEIINWQKHYYVPLGPICKDLGLVWGGGWVNFKDYPHIEIPSDVA
jgi:peptidoglycan LD-endopeptidase CwlK